MGHGHISERYRLAEAIAHAPKERESPVIAIQSISGIAQSAMSQTHKIESLGFARAIADCPPNQKGFFQFPEGLSERLCIFLTVQPFTFGHKPLRRNALIVFGRGDSQFFDSDCVASAEPLLSLRADRQTVVAGPPGQR